jgi:hypothetical protein
MILQFIDAGQECGSYSAELEMTELFQTKMVKMTVSKFPFAWT